MFLRVRSSARNNSPPTARFAIEVAAMSTPAFPDVRWLTDRLAGDNSRVSGFVDSLPGVVDRLVDATLTGNLTRVAEIGGQLARESSTAGLANITACADRVCASAEQADDPVELRRSVLKLIEACGQAKNRGE